MGENMDKWKSYTSGYVSVQELRRDLWEGRLIKEDVPRAILWKVLLLYGTLESTEWGKIDERNAKEYNELIQEYGNLEDRDKKGSESLDPLSEPIGMEQDLGVVIIQDVERSFPEIEFFRSPQTVNVLLRVLYYYAKLNPSVGYRQGMHELASSLLYVMADSLNPINRQAEADTFALFTFIMKNLQQWYIPPSAILAKSQAIQERIIRLVDPQLYKALNEAGVEPQIWAIRWTRLLFSREFGLNNTLYLWDALFAADGSTLGLVDYVCVAMLLRIRGQIIGSDHTTMLMVLLNYPTDPSRRIDDHPFMYIKNAVKLRRSPSQEVARSITAQYPFLNSIDEAKGGRSRPMSPHQALNSIREAARTVTKSLDLDRRVKGAREAWHSAPSDIRDRATIEEDVLGVSPKVSRKPSAELDQPTRRKHSSSSRNEQLVEVLNDSLGALEKAHFNDTSIEITRALEGLRVVRESLLDPERPIKTAVRAKPISPTKNEFPGKDSLEDGKPDFPSTGLSHAGRGMTFHTPTRTLLANSEFSWMLSSPTDQTSGYKKSDSSPVGLRAKDLFELS